MKYSFREKYLDYKKSTVPNVAEQHSENNIMLLAMHEVSFYAGAFEAIDLHRIVANNESLTNTEKRKILNKMVEEILNNLTVEIMSGKSSNEKEN